MIKQSKWLIDWFYPQARFEYNPMSCTQKKVCVELLCIIKLCQSVFVYIWSTKCTAFIISSKVTTIIMKYTVLHIGISECQVNCHLKTLRRKLKPDNRNKRLLLKTQQRHLGEKKRHEQKHPGKKRPGDMPQKFLLCQLNWSRISNIDHFLLLCANPQFSKW